MSYYHYNMKMDVDERGNPWPPGTIRTPRDKDPIVNYSVCLVTDDLFFQIQRTAESVPEAEFFDGKVWRNCRSWQRKWLDNGEKPL